METRNLFVEMLREHVDTERVVLGLVKQLHLCEHLVGERARHHEARMASSATEVHETTLREDDDLLAVFELPDVGAGLEFVTNGA